MGALSRYHLFKNELEELIEAEILRLKDDMSLGLLTDFESYKSATGKISGLRAVLDLIDEAESRVNQKIGA